MTAEGATLVIDASVAVKWVLDEPGGAWARTLPSSGLQLIAPNLLCTECSNALWRMVRTKRMGASLLEQFWSAIHAGPLALHHADLSLNAAALHLSSRLDHPIYDCLYLALAIDRGAALATADQRFIWVVTHTGALPPDRLLIPPEGTA